MAEPAPAPGAKGGRPQAKVWAIAIAAILLVLFVGLNSQEVEINFIVAEAQAPLIVALVIAGALGALIGWAAPRVRRGGGN